jgi:hypothetical protein
MKKRVPSEAQAKAIASMWSGGPRWGTRGVQLERHDGKPPYNDPTTSALVKYGWLVPTGETKEYANGIRVAMHTLSPTALDALEDFLREHRFKTMPVRAA